MDRDALAELFGQIAVHAGAIILPYHAQLDAARRKADGSPVTDADEASERYILAALQEKLPDIPVIAEEEQAAGIGRAVGERFLLVDPLDGTREFIKGRAEFAVNIGLIEKGVPVAGAIYAPLLSKLWLGGATACELTVEAGASLTSALDRKRIATREAPEGALTVVASRSHPDRKTGEFIDRLPVEERISAGSSLKFCLVAEGRADVYPRFGPTMEWDVAAGHAIIAAAGGVVLDGEGRPFRYGKHKFESGPFVAVGQPDLAKRLFR
jgi:3'(2'), 5'-bisphosphate nucleotidase